MAILKEDIELEFYTHIYNWHFNFGRQKLVEIYGKVDAYSKAYLELVEFLPIPSESSSADRDFVFGEVISMLMEWSYQQLDEDGVSLGTYAHRALEIKYEKGFNDDAYQNNKKHSYLYSKFSYENWNKNF